MSASVDYWTVIGASLLVTMSPGPATLTIAGTAMTSGRRAALAVASGSTTGSWMWSAAAALGMSALMLANVWVFDLMRYFGAAYLMFLGFKSARSALTPGDKPPPSGVEGSRWRAYRRGLTVHLTNPKAVLFFASLYSVVAPKDAEPMDLFGVFLLAGAISMGMFHLNALLFSSKPMARAYLRYRRGFEGVFAVAFGAAGMRILTTRLA